ncbi:MAG: hypothetical protein KTR24_11655 [Saprospiraceae bacterium]|nr:hypothetical protein [Saprospiraceae bacterium]
MFSQSYSSMGWSGFFLLILVVFFLGMIYFRIIHPRLSQHHFTGGSTQFNLSALSRFLAGALTLIVVVAFIFINYPTHLVLVLFLAIIFHDAIFNFIQGTILILELDLREGHEVEAGEDRGVIQEAKWTGLAIAQGSKSAFLPYRLLAREGVRVYKQDMPEVRTLRCTWQDDELVQARRLIENKLFAFPYVIDGSKPVLEVAEEHIDVSLALTNSKYVDSLSEILSNAGLQVEVLN